MRRYNEYKYSFGERIGIIIIYVFILAAIAYFFYRSIVFFFISLFTIPIFLNIYKKEKISVTRSKLAEEFVELLNSVNANVKAGYATENAFLEAAKDMKLFYGEKSLIVSELTNIKNGLELNQPLESMLKNLGERSGVEDILVFSKVFETAKRNGGNVREVLEKTAETMKEKMDVEKEISVLISQKKLELTIMECIPFFIIAYIDITSKGYFDILYHNFKGAAFMTLCLFIYLFSAYLGSLMVKINV